MGSDPASAAQSGRERVAHLADLIAPLEEPVQIVQDVRRSQRKEAARNRGPKSRTGAADLQAASTRRLLLQARELGFELSPAGLLADMAKRTAEAEERADVLEVEYQKLRTLAERQADVVSEFPEAARLAGEAMNDAATARDLARRSEADASLLAGVIFTEGL